jgi:hypothetical protein
MHNRIAVAFRGGNAHSDPDIGGGQSTCRLFLSEIRNPKNLICGKYTLETEFVT